MDFLLHIDLVSFITTIGLIGLTLVIFSECGLLLGILFPGDSLLFVAGFLASRGTFDITTLIILTGCAAIAGNVAGYAIGKRFGLKLFKREDSLFFKKEYVSRTEHFFAAHGSYAILLSRFLPIVRTITPLLAGIGAMNYRSFISQSLLGAFLWAMVIPVLGYFLGNSIPDIDRYLLPIILGIIFLSFLPPIIHLIQQKQKESR